MGDYFRRCLKSFISLAERRLGGDVHLAARAHKHWHVLVILSTAAPLVFPPLKPLQGYLAHKKLLLPKSLQ